MRRSYFSKRISIYEIDLLNEMNIKLNCKLAYSCTNYGYICICLDWKRAGFLAALDNNCNGGLTSCY